jgi:hypothetical protein
MSYIKEQQKNNHYLIFSEIQKPNIAIKTPKNIPIINPSLKSI